MKLVVVHHHLRPGGVRRVIELAVPHLAAHGRRGLDAVVLASGEPPPAEWLAAFRTSLPGTAVECVVEPSFAYASECNGHHGALAPRVRAGVARLLLRFSDDRVLVWAHNLGLGRNLHLSRELTRACHRAGIPLLVHHHDWWFDNRWHHLQSTAEPTFRALPAVARAVLAVSPHIRHVAINRTDARLLHQHLGRHSGWLPNPVEPAPPPADTRVAAARSWLRRMLHHDGPVWLLPCRLLRRKNIAEALLLTRWLRPDAWLVTTGGASSAEEKAYAQRLADAARQHQWPLRLGILAGPEPAKPPVPDLLAASETVLLTSLQEGFGLPFLEASAMRRPLIARRLPNIAPDLRQFGFDFPQSYTDILVDPSLFDWPAERRRQEVLFTAWRRSLPRAARVRLGIPALLAAQSSTAPVAFSRLTLAAQLEVLAQPAEYSWQRCALLNPFLPAWRIQASTRRLKPTPWPRSAQPWISGRAYARRFFRLIPTGSSRIPAADAGVRTQQLFLQYTLNADHLYPLLWLPTS